jgi:hypothetical protein
MSTSSTIDENVIVRSLACIHPMDLVGMMAESIVLLAHVSGLDEDHALFMPLRAVRTPDELAKVDWEELTRDLQFQAWLHAKACERTLLSIRLLADRALLHRLLYLSKSTSTLRLLGMVALPLCPMPLELLDLAEEFHQSMSEADRALHAGRTLLGQFQSQMLQGVPLIRIAPLLDQARMCYEDYQRKVEKASTRAGYARWYLKENEHSVASEGTIASEATSQASPFAA